MATEKDFELLDDYLANRMSVEEKTSFEKRLDGDPNLKQAYLHQQKIVEHIRQARITELKAMLNNAPVPSGVQWNSISRVASWIAAGAIVATGLYFFWTMKKDQPEHAQSPVIETIEPETEVEPSIDSAEKGGPSVSLQATGEEQSVQTQTVQKQKPAKPVEEKVPGLDVFDPTEENNPSPEVHGPISPENKVQGTSSIIVENITGTKAYNFHYQFVDGKLLLYGSFERNLYEIMEFFSDNKRTMFLFYKNNYYLLSEETNNVKPLIPINDPALLQKLRASREN